MSVAATKSASTADRLREMADKMDREVEDARRPMTQNPTPKRMRERQNRLLEADNMEHAARAMRAWADAHEAGRVPAPLVSVRPTKAAAIRMTEKPIRATGMYSIEAGDDYTDHSEAAVQLRELTADATTTAQREADELARKAAEINRLEREALMANIPGYFPTPPELAARMAEMADIHPDHDVVEPSAGAGHIADAIRAACPWAALHCFEANCQLADLLELKGHCTPGGDWMNSHLAVNPDRIVMNPPFEKGQDVQHVHKALATVKPGGRVVAIMAPGIQYREDALRTRFRSHFGDWITYCEQLPPGTFKGSGTGAAAVLLVFDKPSDN